MQPIIEKIQMIERQLNANFIDRNGEIHAILLGILAKKNVLFIGAPGVAKSSVIDRVMSSFQPEIHTFSRLISPTTQPEELFGAARFDRLKEGIIERNVEGQLPVAHFAFLDEIFKSTSDLLNGLLKIMNEHRFENGLQQIESPLFTLIGASNEFPEEDALEALYDRFLIRREVEAIKTPARFIEMLQGNVKKTDVSMLSLNEIVELQKLTSEVTIPFPILVSLTEIHFKLKDYGIHVSDRRTKHCMEILQASAVLQNRNYVKESDFSALADCLWNEAEDRQIVLDVLYHYTKSVSEQQLLKMAEIVERAALHNQDVAQQKLGVNFQTHAQFAVNLLDEFKVLENAFLKEDCSEDQHVEYVRLKENLHRYLAEDVL